MTSSTLTATATLDRPVSSAKSFYQEDQQIKFMTLQAEADSLLEQLQAIKAERLGSTTLNNLSQN
ncbi:MAG: hypothetical protein VKJ24_05220 [Synechococcales bacterium]|nr:hypothetical protein [Synechococcales bacterium]